MPRQRTDRPTFTITIEYIGTPNVPYAVPWNVALRRLLKAALRYYPGFLTEA